MLVFPGETAFRPSATSAMKHVVLEIGSHVLDRLGRPFRKRFRLVTSLEELGEQYQASDLRYKPGTYVWANIMRREVVEGDFNPNDGQVICATKCLGFVEIGRFVVAVVRQCWFGIEDPPIENFNLEPVFYTTTADYIRDPNGVGTRHGIRVNPKYNKSGGFVFELGWVDFEYGDLPWGDLLRDIIPHLVRELAERPSLIQFSH
jgi:hypothetical protein